MIIVDREIKDFPASKAFKVSVVFNHNVVVLSVCVTVNFPYDPSINKCAQGVINGRF